VNDYDVRLAVLAQQLRTLPDKPEETPESTLKALWLAAAGQPASAERSESSELPRLDARQLQALDRLVERRLRGEPLGHITGRQAFMGLDLMVGPDALLPRRETEILGRAACEIARDLVDGRREILVVDVCCGCGNVALAVAHHVCESKVIGVDLAEPAVRLAERNAAHLNLEARVSFEVGDLLQPVDGLAGQVDLITCNPPYIATANVDKMDSEISSHEPSLAFDGGPFGVKILRRLVKEASAVLRPGGYLAFEVGRGQGEPMVAQLEKHAAYEWVEGRRDADGAIRAIVARTG
jgi:release factor glutamine methyltransferase